MSKRKDRMDTQDKTVSNEPKSGAESKANFGNGSRFIYVFEGKMKPTEKVIVKREIWKGHYHSVARREHGWFVSSQKYTKKKHLKFQDDYGIRKRTLTISSSRKFDMQDSRQKEMVLDAVNRKYENWKYPGYQWDKKSVKYRYTYDGVSGVKV